MKPSVASRSSPAEESIASAIVLTVVKSLVATFSKASAFASAAARSAPSSSSSEAKGSKVSISILASNPKISRTSSPLIPAATNVVKGVIMATSPSETEAAVAFITIFSTAEPDIVSRVLTLLPSLSSPV